MTEKIPKERAETQNPIDNARLAEQLKACVDDPQPSISHEEAMRLMDEEIEALSQKKDRQTRL
ncbi:hypothetical protein [Pseudomonas sp. 6D_7.1_Bac1]|uniref:hypothetical protein n=1 Tax=Pseudomonas sp. 6D_7.1_Bac1 TaxID=2971615 RepID=UPI0021C6BD81|nr:hypothetical protein [Pseudomonas sp. 6D_7.1_Bac1]MCU1751888.1 hypothetical protein [Pseudomonas sp. 6D_7.1_Bac1]